MLTPYKPATPTPMHEDRRRFLRLGSAAAVSLLLPFPLSGRPSECDPTTPDIEGPYYKAGSPYRVQIAQPSEPGQRLLISGIAHAADCTTPLPNVVLDIWQADDSGTYDTSETYRLRGKVATAADGRYSFETIMPGKYQGRPHHIHFMLGAPGQPPVITQLYFAGDPDIAIDPWASQPAAARRIITLTESDTGTLHGTFDLVIDASTDYSEGKPAPSTPGVLFHATPNPCTTSTVIRGELAAPAVVELSIVDIYGRRIRRLEYRRMEPGSFIAHWDTRSDTGHRAAPGTYVCRLVVNGIPVDYHKILLQ